MYKLWYNSSQVNNQLKGDVIMIKQIPGFKFYYADTEGNIYSKVNNAGKERKELYKLKLVPDRYGYLNVGLHHKLYKVHRLIAMTFIENKEDKPQVNHIDGDKTNNNVSNLEWCTSSENTQHAFDTGLHKINYAENVSTAKLTNKEYISLIQDILDGLSNDDIANKYGLHSRYVSLIRHKKRLKTIWDTYFKDKVASKSEISYDKNKVESIVKDALTTKLSNAEIGRIYNIDSSVISRIRNGKKVAKKYQEFIQKYK
jgi:hypothetical protein